MFDKLTDRDTKYSYERGKKQQKKKPNNLFCFFLP